MRTLAIDVGNTRATAVLFEESEVTHEAAISIRATTQELGEFCDELAGWSPHQWVLGQVHRRGEELAELLQQRIDTPFDSFASGEEFPVVTDVEEPAEVGVDRLAAALGAYSQSEAGALVVDVGTAVTVDWIDAGGVFRGGAIVPGERLGALALHQETDRLPLVELQRPPATLPGRSTREAIQAGLDVGWAALIDGLVRNLEQATRGEATRWLTGGGSERYLERTELRFRRDPHLVTRGLLAARTRTTVDPRIPGGN